MVPGGGSASGPFQLVLYTDPSSQTSSTTLQQVVSQVVSGTPDASRQMYHDMRICVGVQPLNSFHLDQVVVLTARHDDLCAAACAKQLDDEGAKKTGSACDDPGAHRG